MESLATVGVPAIGYGIRYEFGIFDQQIRDGWQVEVTGQVAALRQSLGSRAAGDRVRREVRRAHRGVHRRARALSRALDPAIAREAASLTTPPFSAIGVPNANLLRLWSAQASESFDLQAFNVGDYYRAVEHKVDSENLTKMLYPNDEPVAGKRLRLQQQYLLRLLLAPGHDPAPPPGRDQH